MISQSHKKTKQSNKLTLCKRIKEGNKEKRIKKTSRNKSSAIVIGKNGLKQQHKIITSISLQKKKLGLTVH